MKKTILFASALYIAISATDLSAQAQLLYTFTGVNSGDRLGQGLACTGPFSSTSSTSDFFIGDPGSNTTLGRIRGFKGSDGSTSVYTKSGTVSSEEVGSHLESMGDINKDGKDDFLRGGGSASSSIVEIIFSPTGSSTVVLTSSNGVTPQFDGFGEASAPLMDDVNSDGINDVIVGAPKRGISVTEDGLVGVYSGADGSTIREIVSSIVNQQMGSAVSSITDRSSDGKRDIVVGSPGDTSNTGKVEVYQSSGGGTAIQTATGSVVGDKFGFSISLVGDVNGDLVDDIIVGAPDGDNLAGYAKLLSGANFSTLCTVAGGVTGDKIGFTVRGVGDQNNDGVPDFAVAATGVNAGNGRVVIYRYNPASTSGACVPLVTFDGTTLSQHYGFRIAGSSIQGKCDFNGDGFNDFAISSETDLSDTKKGWVDVYAQIAPTPTPTSTPTITSTPIPTVTPTETPNITVTSTPLPELPRKAKLTYRITRSGDLEAINTLGSDPAERCVVTLLGRRSRSDFSERGKIIELGSKIADKATTFRATGLPKPHTDSNKKPYLFHLITKISCKGGKDFYSNIFARRLTCGRKPAVDVSKWENVLQTRID